MSRFPAVTVLLAMLTASATAAAQETPSRSGAWELRIPGGALIGTGEQRHHLKDAQLTAVQVSRTLTPRLAVTGTFAWARSRDIAAGERPRLDVFTSDLGLEARSSSILETASTSLTTFAGLGAGARSYNYRSLDIDATSNLAGYVAAGAELGAGRFALRVEARDYATGFKPLVGGGRSSTRNDVVIMAALRFNRRAAESR